MYKKFFLILLIINISSLANGDDISVKVKGDGNITHKNSKWYVPGSWINTSTLDSDNSEIIFYGTGQDTIINPNGSFSQIEVQNPDGVKLESPITIQDSLKLSDGTIDNTDFNILMGGAGAIEVIEGDLIEPPEYQGIIDVIYGGFMPQVTGIELPYVVNNLTINNPGGVTLNKNVAVTDNFNLYDGNLYDENYALSLRDTARVFVKKGTLSDTLDYQGRVNITYTGDIGDTTGKELTPNVDHLTIDNPGNVTLDKILTVDSTLTFLRGKLITDGYKLILGPYAIIINGDPGDVWGTMQMPPFWVGTDSFNKMGVFIGSGVDNIGKVYIIIISGNGSQATIDERESIMRRWIITSDYPPSNGRHVALTWYPEEDNNNDLAIAQAWKSSDEGQTWQRIGNIQDVTDSRTINMDVTAFSQWTMVSDLPINFNRIDMQLVQHLIARLGSVSGEDSYDSNFDVDSDGDIDMTDLSRMIRQWGKNQ